MNEKEVCGGEGGNLSTALAESLVCNHVFSKKRTPELNFCPLQRGEKARAGEESIYLSVWDENGVVRDVKMVA